MSKRGLSRDEKRTKMLEIFHETVTHHLSKLTKSEFFTLKDLEKIAPKQKGIVQQSVKEILDELTSDDLVTFDKIGTSNYYWSFPSKAGKRAQLDKAEAENATLTEKIEDTRRSLAAAKEGREDTDERRALIAKLDQARAHSDCLKGELAALGAADPVRYEEKRKAVGVAKRAAEVWTENTMVLWSLMRANPAFEDAALREHLGIDESWEDVDFS